MSPIADEREWTLVREAQYVEGRVLSGPDVDEPVVVVPKSSREAAEAEVERLRERLRDVIAVVESNQERVSHGHNDGWANQHRALDRARAALSPREDAPKSWKQIKHDRARENR